MHFNEHPLDEDDARPIEQLSRRGVIALIYRVGGIRPTVIVLARLTWMGVQDTWARLFGRTAYEGGE